VPWTQIPNDNHGDSQTCYQYVNSLRDINLKALGVTNNPTQSCIANLVAAMANTPAAAPFLCPLVAPGNGSPVGCFRSSNKRFEDLVMTPADYLRRRAAGTLPFELDDYAANQA